MPGYVFAVICVGRGRVNVADLRHRLEHTQLRLICVAMKYVGKVTPTRSLARHIMSYHISNCELYRLLAHSPMAMMVMLAKPDNRFRPAASVRASSSVQIAARSSARDVYYLLTSTVTNNATQREAPPRSQRRRRWA